MFHVGVDIPQLYGELHGGGFDLTGHWRNSFRNNRNGAASLPASSIHFNWILSLDMVVRMY